MSIAEVFELPTGRVLFSDDQGRVLRATWHLDRGFVNLSVWFNDRCTETFRLTLGDAAQFVAFLVEGLSDATARLLNAVTTAAPSGPPRREGSATGRFRAGRTRLGGWIMPKG
jgi:hypothetical protein